MKLSKKKIIVAAAITLAVGSAASAAFAYFTSTGTGSGTATVGGATSIQVTVDSVTDLAPGVGAKAVHYHIKNTGGANTLIDKINITTPGSPACPASNFSLNGAAAGAPFTATGLATPLSPGGQLDWPLTVELVETNQPQDGCIGAGVDVVVKVNL